MKLKFATWVCGRKQPEEEAANPASPIRRVQSAPTPVSHPTSAWSAEGQPGNRQLHEALMLKSLSTGGGRRGSSLRRAFTHQPPSTSPNAHARRMYRGGTNTKFGPRSLPGSLPGSPIVSPRGNPMNFERTSKVSKRQWSSQKWNPDQGLKTLVEPPTSDTPTSDTPTSDTTSASSDASVHFVKFHNDNSSRRPRSQARSPHKAKTLPSKRHRERYQAPWPFTTDTAAGHRTSPDARTSSAAAESGPSIETITIRDGNRVLASVQLPS